MKQMCTGVCDSMKPALAKPIEDTPATVTQGETGEFWNMSKLIFEPSKAVDWKSAIKRKRKESR